MKKKLKIYLIISTLIFLITSNLYALEYKLVKKWGGFDATYGNKEGEFNYPCDLAIDNDGFVYVVDWGNDRVQKFNKDGKFILSFGKGKLNRPVRIALDKKGNIFVVDSLWVRHFDKKGNFIKDLIEEPLTKGIACDNSYIYIATEEWEEDMIEKIDYTGKIVKEWKIESSLSKSSIGYLIYDDIDNNLYLSYGEEIKIYNTEGKVICDRWAGIKFPGLIGGIGIRNNGNGKYIYIAHPIEENIIMYDFSGKEIKILRDIVTYCAIGQVGFSFDKDGNIYLPELSSHRIIKYTPNLEYISEWRKDPEPGKFHNPVDIAIDSEGYVYVLDRDNYRVQKFTSNGEFIEQWGKKGTEDNRNYVGYDIMYEIMIDRNDYIYILHHKMVSKGYN